MVSFKKITTGAVVLAATGSVVEGQSIVNSIAGRMSNVIVSARHTNVPEAKARSEVGKMVGFVTTDSRLSGFFESAIETAQHSSINPSIASAYLTSIGSVLSSVTRKPDFYSVVNHARRGTSDYDASQIAAAGAQELKTNANGVFRKVAAIASTDRGVSSLMGSLTNDFIGVATKVFLNGGFGIGNLEVNLAADDESKAFIADITDFWVQEENAN